MNPVLKFCNAQKTEAGLREAEAPTSPTTTLYDVMAALQTAVEPNEDDLVVAVVVHWLRSGRLTFVGDVTVAA